MHKRYTYYYTTITIILLLVSLHTFSQELVVSDTITEVSDSTQHDSLSNVEKETEYFQVSPNAVETEVDYLAKDSITLDAQEQIIYLYGDAEINYDGINVKAERIRINFNENLLFAEGILDSNNNKIGSPIFTETDNSFKSENITYNFTTKKGIIKNIITNEGESYLHGKKVKKMPDKSINIRNGMYTTCDAHNPHFYVKFTKAKVIPDDKIITGPALFCIEGIPTPLILPFGFFPNKKGRSSGILLPAPGESSNRGFFLNNGGFYFGMSDYVDLAIRGDIYSRGSWATRTATSYKKRYKYEGVLNADYTSNIFGDKIDEANYKAENDFAIRWTHRQDPKASLNSSFSAKVNIVSKSYNKLNETNAEQRFNNSMQSNISYSRSLFRNKWNFSTNLNHKQNTRTQNVEVTLPEITLNRGRFYPLRRKKRKGKMRFYENISMSYAMNSKNRVNLPDSMLFSPDAFDFMQNGVRHSIPISSSIKLLKHFSWVNTVNYTGRMYWKSIYQNWNSELDVLEKDTISGFEFPHEFSYSSSLNFRVYGMLMFKKGPLKALRHVVTPQASFSWRPDFSNDFWGYYKTYDNSMNQETSYSIYSGQLYGSPGSGKQGMVNFSVSNNIEMKIRNRKDSIIGTKKVVLIENLTGSMSYNLSADSMNWSFLNVRGRTRLFKRLDLQYTGAWDPYTTDSSGLYRYNRLEWDYNNRLLRRSKNDMSVSLNWRFKPGDFKRKTSPVINEKKDETYLPEEVINYTVPWDATISYSFRYSNNIAQLKKSTIQTLNFSGNIELSPKWRLGFRSGYDFQNSNFSYTSVDIYRDLHCWEMHLNWIPIGYFKSYNFTIKAKSNMLQDLKFEKKNDFKDRL